MTHTTPDARRPRDSRGPLRPTLITWAMVSAAALGAAAACDRSSSTPTATADHAEGREAAPTVATAQARQPRLTDVGAAAICPPLSFTTGINLATNASFEQGGPPTSYPPGPIPPPSAATGWVMHTDNFGSPVKSARIATTVPGPGGSKMLAFRAGGSESGVIQQFAAPAKVMFSVWVYVKSGRVQINMNGGPGGPAAYSTKYNEWEQLRICSDGAVATGAFEILNQDANGGEFAADRVEILEIP